MDSIEFAFGQINSLLKRRIRFYAQVAQEKTISAEKEGKKILTA
jgi:chorismate mutase